MQVAQAYSHLSRITLLLASLVIKRITERKMPAQNQIKYFVNKPTERAQLHNVNEREMQKRQHRPVAESAAHS